MALHREGQSSSATQLRTGNTFMNTKIVVFAVLTGVPTGLAMAQDRALQGPRPGDHGPPPQAYEDCRGKRAGDAIQHATPEGKVAATCMDSPRGLVARPNQPPGARPDARPQQKALPQ
jgi:hypothetical protein